MSIELLCRCGDLASDHETLAVWSVAQLTEFGSPCNRCQADPSKLERLQQGMFCKGFEEWPIDEIPYPGSYAAVVIGCECLVGINMRRAAKKMEPLYDAECAVHAWVCQRREECVHESMFAPMPDERLFDVMRHRGAHETCEHCTIPRIECATCGRLWSDWRVSPSRNGWVEFYEIEKHQSCGPSTSAINFKSVTWRCDTCLSSE